MASRKCQEKHKLYSHKEVIDLIQEGSGEEMMSDSEESQQTDPFSGLCPTGVMSEEMDVRRDKTFLTDSTDSKQVDSFQGFRPIGVMFEEKDVTGDKTVLENKANENEKIDDLESIAILAEILEADNRTTDSEVDTVIELAETNTQSNFNFMDTTYSKVANISESVKLNEIDETLENIDTDDPFDKTFQPSDSESESCSSLDESNTEVSKKRMRNKKPKPEKWKMNVAKKMRLMGEDHTSRRGHIIDRKKLGPRCSSKFCEKSKFRNCNDITDDERELIFTQFWDLKSWNERKTFVTALVASVKKKQKTSNTETRGNSHCYNLKLSNGSTSQVCKAMFCSTIGMSQRTIGDWLNPTEASTAMDKESTRSGPTQRMSEESVGFLKQWLLGVPCVESHYCRKATAYRDKRFLQPGTKVSKLYEQYQTDANQAGQRVAGFTYFKEMFRTLNLSIFIPRKDQCDTCIGAKQGNISEEDHQKHLAAKDHARAEKSRDKEQAAADESLSVWTMDTQAVLLCPQSKASALYYRTKLQVHNFTLHNMTSHDGYCYMWDETDGDLSSETFAFIQYKHFKSVIENSKIKELIIWSDGCGYQNKNANLANIYAHLSKETGVKITQKYLVSGHTNMECDSMHSVIERNIRGDIFLPRDLLMVMQTARKSPGPYVVQQLSFDDFKKMNDTYLNSIRPGKKVGDPTVNMLSMIQYRPNMELLFKLFGEDQDWKTLPVRVKGDVKINWVPIFQAKRPITSRKFNDLQIMKKVMPKQVHSFYDGLIHE